MSPENNIVATINRIYSKGMTTASGGNISIKDDQGTVWITPSAIDKGSLKADDIVCIFPDGSFQGKHKPSSELPFHNAIYQVRHDIRAIIHAHPPGLVTFSIIRQMPDVKIIPAIQKVCGNIGYASYDLPGGVKLGNAIADIFTNKDIWSVIMENHAVVVGGKDIDDAFVRLDALEFCARAIINSITLGKLEFLEDNPNRNITESKSRKNELIEVKYNSEKQIVANELCTFIERIYAKELTNSFYCHISSRIGYDNEFLITQEGFKPWLIKPNDLVYVHNEKSETGKISSHFVDLHQSIYQLHPGINCIFQTQPPNLMAFALTNEEFTTRTIPESWIFLQDVPFVSYNILHSDTTFISRLFSRNCFSIIANNESFLVTGNSLIQAFDRLEIAEFNAKSIIMSKKLGKVIPLNEDQINALRRKFL